MIPHPHIAARKIAGPPTHHQARARVHGSGPVGRFNAKVGLKITMVVGTMWTGYLFTLIALISAPAAFASGNSLIIVAWISQAALQLILLPVIIVGQNVQAAAADARSLATFNDATAILATVLATQEHVQALETQLRDVLRGGA